ncbi:MAG: phosphohydrolase (MutT/NUDIX family protein) [uncultured bacterium]|nr:MAG: phosphohydrolase (MutT/NUDIX family protein) [uncultured bacterium]
MARSYHFAPGTYGLIAGFVEIGESVEEAVHREVIEETGITIKNIQYFGSQPWPFPDSLMLAFTAQYASGTLTVNTTELEEANWYRFDHLPGRPGAHLSIANQLIDHFIKSQQNKPPIA